VRNLVEGKKRNLSGALRRGQIYSKGKNSGQQWGGGLKEATGVTEGKNFNGKTSSPAKKKVQTNGRWGNHRSRKVYVQKTLGKNTPCNQNKKKKEKEENPRPAAAWDNNFRELRAKTKKGWKKKGGETLKVGATI